MKERDWKSDVIPEGAHIKDAEVGCYILACKSQAVGWCNQCGRPACNTHRNSDKHICMECDITPIVDMTDGTAGDILFKAQQIVEGTRQEDYGRPADSYKRVAEMWSAILGFEVTPRRVCLCLIAMKVARDAHRPKEDNLIDIAGYARVIEMIERDSHGF